MGSMEAGVEQWLAKMATTVNEDVWTVVRTVEESNPFNANMQSAVGSLLSPLLFLTVMKSEGQRRGDKSNVLSYNKTNRTYRRRWH